MFQPGTRYRAMRNILIVDDEPGIRRTVSMLLEGEGFRTLEATNVSQAKDTLTNDTVDVVILDLHLQNSNGMDLLRDIYDTGSMAECIVMTAHGTIKNAVESMRLGAYDYLTKPVDPTELIIRIKRVLEKKFLSEEVNRLREELTAKDQFSHIVAVSQPMVRVMDVVKRIRNHDIPVLITGATGTGKEVVAKAIHSISLRADKRFLAVNCCTLPEDLLDSELFGHTKGSFTGATRDSRGLFQQADEGTLFLDEIGEISPSLQAKLLRVLQDGVIRPVGSEKQFNVDVRVIAATNHDLEAAVESGAFRKDLYFRLNVLPIHLQPLSERPEDILPLAKLFIDRMKAKLSIDELGITHEACSKLIKYHWPGNARQLENVIERGFALASKHILDHSDIIFDFSDASRPAAQEEDSDQLALNDHVEKHVRNVLKMHDGNQVAAARALGVSRSTLRRKLKIGK